MKVVLSSGGPSTVLRAVPLPIEQSPTGRMQ